MTIFAMVNMQQSIRYTELAIASFFDHTRLSNSDTFFVIDNDCSLPDEVLNSFPNAKLIRNKRPKSFAQNLNAMRTLALQESAPLFFLNNDLVFTKDWYEPFRSGVNAIASPIANETIDFRTSEHFFPKTLSLDEFLPHRDKLQPLVDALQPQRSGFLRTFVLPFFAVYLPVSILERHGPLDESYGLGGGEDTDYCLRADLAQIPLAYCFDSYVLHFNGASTDQFEDTATYECRVGGYRKRFVSVWGRRLASVTLGYRLDAIQQAGLMDAMQAGDFAKVITQLRILDGLPPHPPPITKTS